MAKWPAAATYSWLIQLLILLAAMAIFLPFVVPILANH